MSVVWQTQLLFKDYSDGGWAREEEGKCTDGMIGVKGASETKK